MHDLPCWEVRRDQWLLELLRLPLRSLQQLYHGSCMCGMRRRHFHRLNRMESLHRLPGRHLFSLSRGRLLVVRRWKLHGRHWGNSLLEVSGGLLLDHGRRKDLQLLHQLRRRDVLVDDRRHSVRILLNRKILDDRLDGMCELPCRHVRGVSWHGCLHGLWRRVLLEHNWCGVFGGRLPGLRSRSDLRGGLNRLLGLPRRLVCSFDRHELLHELSGREIWNGDWRHEPRCMPRLRCRELLRRRLDVLSGVQGRSLCEDRVRGVLSMRLRQLLVCGRAALQSMPSGQLLVDRGSREV